MSAVPSTLLEVTLSRPAIETPFGLRFAMASRGGAPGLIVTGIVAGSPAQASGIKVGWNVIRLNGVLLSGMPMAAMKTLIATSTKGSLSLRLAVRANEGLHKTVMLEKSKVKQARHAVTAMPHVEPHDVTLKRDLAKGGSFGVVFAGTSRGSAVGGLVRPGVFVSRVVPGSAADTQHQVPKGAKVLAINGLAVENVYAISRLLNAVVDSITLTLAGMSPLYGDYCATGHELQSQVGAKRFRLTKGPRDTTYGLTYGGAASSAELIDGQAGVFISGAVSGTPGSRGGQVPFGYQILQVGSVDASNCTLQDFVLLLQQHDHDAYLEFLAVRNVDLVEAYTKVTPRMVTLRQRSDAGFGVFMSGAMLDTGHPDPANSGVIISGVKPGGVAARTGQCLVGFQILQINGQNVATASTEEASNALRKVVTELTMQVAPNRKLAEACNIYAPEFTWPLYDTQVAVTLQKDPLLGYGLVFEGAKSAHEASLHGPGLIVSGLRPRSPAAQSGRIPVGWQVVRMNGADVRENIFQDVLSVLDQIEDSTLTVVLEANTTLRAVYDRLAKSGKQRDAVLVKQEAKKASTDTAVSKGKGMSSGTAGMLSMMAMGSAVKDDRAVVESTLQRRPEGYGITFEGARTDDEGEDYGYGLYVKSVKAGSSAGDAGGVPVGWQLITANGLDLEDGTFVELKQAMGSVGNSMTLTFKENPSLVRAYTNLRRGKKVEARGDTVTTSLQKSPSGFGLIFGGAQTQEEGETFGYGVFVKGRKPGSVADDNLDIKPGMQVVKMNGVDLTNATFSLLKTTLGRSGQELLLELRANTSLYSAYMQRKTAKAAAKAAASAPGPITMTTLTRDAGGFGLKFGGAKSDADAAAYGPGVFVKGSKPNSVAAANAVLRDGVQIMKCNGTRLHSATLEDLKAVIMAAGETLELEVRENAGLIRAYTKKTSAPTAAPRQQQVGGTNGEASSA